MPKVAKGRKFRSSALRKASSGTTTAEDSTKQKAVAVAETPIQEPGIAEPNHGVVEAAIYVIIISSRARNKQAESRTERSVKTRPEHHHRPRDDDNHQRRRTGTASLSRGQRKRQAKRDQYLRREKLILSSLQLQKAQEQARRIDGLDAMKEALLATVVEKAGDPVQNAMCGRGWRKPQVHEQRAAHPPQP